MRVTTKGRYAVRAVLNLAINCKDDPIPIRRIAQEEGISPDFLEQIFFRLKKAGIIRSVRGPGGGFLLNRRPEEISMKNLFDSVGEGLDLTPCSNCGLSDDDDPGCERRAVCRVYDLWNVVSGKIASYLEDITIAKMIDGSYT